MGEGGRRGAKQREKGRARALVHQSELNLTEDELKNFREQETEQESSQILRLFIICTKKENRRCNHLFSETEIKTTKFHTPMY